MTTHLFLDVDGPRASGRAAKAPEPAAVAPLSPVEPAPEPEVASVAAGPADRPWRRSIAADEAAVALARAVAETEAATIAEAGARRDLLAADAAAVAEAEAEAEAAAVREFGWEQ